MLAFKEVGRELQMGTLVDELKNWPAEVEISLPSELLPMKRELVIDSSLEQSDGSVGLTGHQDAGVFPFHTFSQCEPAYDARAWYDQTLSCSQVGGSHTFQRSGQFPVDSHYSSHR